MSLLEKNWSDVGAQAYDFFVSGHAPHLGSAQAIHFLQYLTSEPKRKLFLTLEPHTAQFLATSLGLEGDNLSHFIAPFRFQDLRESAFLEFCAQLYGACSNYNDKSTIHRFPPEIIIQIIQHVAESGMYQGDIETGDIGDVDDDTYDSLVSDKAALPPRFYPFNSICSKWRNILLHFSELSEFWNPWFVIQSDRSWSPLSTVIAAIQHEICSRRSVDLRLATLRLCDVTTPTQLQLLEHLLHVTESSIPIMKSLYGTVRDHACSIRLEVPQALINDLFSLSPSYWYGLEELSITLRSIFTPPESNGSKIMTFANAVNLRKVHLSSEHYCLGPHGFISRMVLPWNQLTHLTLRDSFSEVNDHNSLASAEGTAYRDAVRGIFRNCASTLQCCRIRMIGWLDDAFSLRENPNEPIINFPHLEELFLDCGSGVQYIVLCSTHMAPMLYNVKFPVLKSLRLWTPHPPKHFAYESYVLNQGADLYLSGALINLQRRSSFPLERFQLINASACGRSIARFLQPITTLRVLDLRRTFFGWTPVVSSIISSTTYLPKLSCLRIDDRALQDDSGSIVWTDDVYERRALLILYTIRNRCIAFGGELKTVVFIVRRPDQTSRDFSSHPPMPSGFVRVLSHIKAFHDRIPGSLGIRIHLESFPLARYTDFSWCDDDLDEDEYEGADEDSIYPIDEEEWAREKLEMDVDEDV